MRKTLILLVLFFCTPAFAADSGNGVERGDLNVHSSASMPLYLANRLEAMIHDNCDLTGVTSINTTYFQVNDNGLIANPTMNDYEIQYAVLYSSEPRTVMINVHARMSLAAANGPAIEILEFYSPICKSIRQ
ncbi:MAG: hypothetical protein ACXVB9_01455 [Bdellovibrionota bacterium]